MHPPFVRHAALMLSLLSPACAGPPPPSASAGSLVWRTQAWQADPISTAQFESHPAFDRRTGSLYFVRSSPAFSGWRMLASACRDGHWSEPQPAPFAGDGVEADPFIARDGRSLFFISSRSENGVKQKELDIWRVDRSGGAAGWGAPERLPEPVNSGGREWFPRLAADGWLYFGSDRPGGLGATDIYRARQKQGRWSIENLGPEVNSPGDEYEAEISPDGERMILMADGDLYLLTRDGKGWSKRQKMGPEINTAGLEVGPAFSPSGRTFIFARDYGKAPLPQGGSGEFVLATDVQGRDWPEEWPRRCG